MKVSAKRSPLSVPHNVLFSVHHSPYTPQRLLASHSGIAVMVQTECLLSCISKKTWCLTSTETIRFVRDRENGGKGYGGGGRGRVYTYHYTVTTRMTCIKMGSGERHFNVSLVVRNKVTRQCPQTTTFEEKGKPKRIRTEDPLLTSLTPYR